MATDNVGVLLKSFKVLIGTGPLVGDAANENVAISVGGRHTDTFWLLMGLPCGVLVSQVSTRLITFGLNLATARLLTIDTYGVMHASHFCLDWQS